MDSPAPHPYQGAWSEFNPLALCSVFRCGKPEADAAHQERSTCQHCGLLLFRPISKAKKGWRHMVDNGLMCPQPRDLFAVRTSAEPKGSADAR